MKRLDRYIAGKYLRTFFFTVLIFTMIGCVIDLSDKMEEFISESVPLREILFVYYANWILWVNNMLFPMYALIGVIFFTSRMAYNSEIISIFNAGVSFRRLILSYLIPAGLIFLLHMAATHFIVPMGNRNHYTFQQTYIDQRTDEGKKSNVHIFLRPGFKVYVKQFISRDSSIRGLRLESMEGSRLKSLLRANKAEWQGPPGKWRLYDYEVRSFQDLSEGYHRGQQMDTLLNLAPSDFVEFRNFKEMMTTPKLQAFINKEKVRGAKNLKKYQVELHRRTAEPFTILILTLIGLSVASRKVRGGMGFHLALGIGLGALYVLLSRFATTFALNAQFPALLGVWIPNLIFAVVAVYMVTKAQK